MTILSDLQTGVAENKIAADANAVVGRELVTAKSAGATLMTPEAQAHLVRAVALLESSSASQISNIDESVTAELVKAAESTGFTAVNNSFAENLKSASLSTMIRFVLWLATPRTPTPGSPL